MLRSHRSQTRFHWSESTVFGAAKFSKTADRVFLAVRVVLTLVGNASIHTHPAPFKIIIIPCFFDLGQVHMGYFPYVCL